MFTKKYVLDLVERMAFTWVAAFVATLVAPEVMTLNVDTLQAAALAGVAAVVTLVKGLLAKSVGSKDSAGIVS